MCPVNSYMQTLLSAELLNKNTPSFKFSNDNVIHSQSASVFFSVNKRLALKLPPPPIKVCGRLKGIHAVWQWNPTHLYAAHTHPSWCFCYRPVKLWECCKISVFSNLPPPMCWSVCASGRPAAPPPPSSLSSGPAGPRCCCWGPGRRSPAAPWASCCSAGRTPTAPATPRTAGRAPPGTGRSPCRWGWAARGTRQSYTWTSPSPWSPAWSASRRCLKESGQREPSSGGMSVLQQTEAEGLNIDLISWRLFKV